MEGLQELARSTFHKEQQFCGSGSDFDIISISAFPSQPTSYMAVPASEGELEPFLAQAAPWNKGEDAEATLKLVHIPRENDGTLRISQHIFLDIFQSFNTEPHTLYMISRNCYGFHCFKANNTSTENISYTFFIGTVLYMLIWSFNPVSMTTRAMLLPRRSNGLRDGKAAFCEFENIVHLYKDYIYTLCLLVFVSSVHVIHFIDEYIAVELNEIRDIEANTGHGAWIKSRSKDRFDIGEITEWSKRVGGCLVDLSNQFRHEQIATSLISFLHGQGDSDWSQNIQDAYLRKHDAGMEIFKSAIPVLQRQADNGKLYVEYLQERAKSQSSVLFGLLTHEDASANLELADANKQLAEAAKKDSSTMKTIAVMTMAFLPATYFAALFAIPSLQWDKPRVIQSKFWIYWAFALPCTALVFLLWFLITNWELITRRLRKRESAKSE